MSLKAVMSSKKWYVLAVLFLVVNACGCFLIHLDLKKQRAVKARVVTPAHGLIQGRECLVLRFSADMVPEDRINMPLETKPLTFHPAVPGSFWWSAPNTLCFEPAHAWPPCNEFVATFSDDRELVSADGRTVDHSQWFALRTEPLIVRSISQLPRVDAASVPEIALVFSQPVSMEELYKYATVTNIVSHRNVKYELTACDSEGSTRHKLVLQDPSTNGIKVILSKGMKSISGPLGLPGEFVWQMESVSTPPGFHLVSMSSQKACEFGPYWIDVCFDQPVSVEKADSHIRVEPPIPFTLDIIESWRSDPGVRLVGDFKPGARYVVSVSSNLASRAGVRLGRKQSRTVYMESALPGIRITSDGTYLSPNGNMLLGFDTINVARCRVRAFKLYANNVVQALQRGNRYAGTDLFGYRAHDSDLNGEVSFKDYSFSCVTNTMASRTLKLREVLGERRGAFSISFEDESRREHARHAVVVSDMGLVARRCDTNMLVWVNSLRTLDPVDGVRISVISHKNQELSSGITDANGLATVAVPLDASKGDSFVVVAEKGEDMTWLPLGASSIVGTEGSVGVRSYLAKGYEAYVYTDRGIYRPGETCHVMATVRGTDVTTPGSFPVTLEIRRPDGRLERTLKTILSANGTAEFTIDWPISSPTGGYSLEVKLPGASETLGSTVVSVEDFVPPQIKVNVKPCDAGTNGLSNVTFEVSSQYLYGTSAAGLSAAGVLQFLPQPVSFSRFKEYQFGDHRKEWHGVTLQVGKAVLDAEGKAVFSGQVSPAWRPPAVLKVVMIGTVNEFSGRAITAYASKTMDVYPFYIGIARQSQQTATGNRHTFKLAAVNPDGSVRSNAVIQCRVDSLRWTTVLKKNGGGSYGYCSEQAVTAVQTNSLRLAGGSAELCFTQAGWGEYRITAWDEESGTSTSMDFFGSDGGQGEHAGSMNNPSKVELVFDKERYVAGEEASLLIKSPFAGKALLTIESTNFISSRIIVMTNNTARLAIPVESRHAPNVYCSVVVLRPAVVEKMWSPHRAAGMAALVVDRPECRLDLKLDVPDSIRPCTKLKVGLDVRGKGGGAVNGNVTIAAVDEGICMLTGFQTPDPFTAFHGPRRAMGSLNDLYSMLVPEIEEQLDRMASEPGGGPLAGLGSRLNPVNARRFRPVALWRSVAVTGGLAQVELDVPEFTGLLRLMAVAIDNARFGAVAKAVTVKRPMVVESSLPRFLAPGDRFKMPLKISNESRSNGEAIVSLVLAGPLVADGGGTGLARKLSLAAGASTNISFVLAAAAKPGVATCEVSVAMGDDRYLDSTELAVRPASARVTKAGIGVVRPGSSAEITFEDKWLEGTEETELWVSSLPAVHLTGGLKYLLNYPYGCIEQTTSKSFPLLYLSDLAEELYPGWLTSEDVARYVDAGIRRILDMQRHDGSFGYWPGGSETIWGSIYATHFLAEARKGGYDVPEQYFNRALHFIEEWIAHDAKDGDEYNRTYGAMVLSLAGRPQSGILNRLCEKLGGTNDVGLRVHVAAALMAAGHRKDARAFLGEAGGMTSSWTDRDIGGEFRAPARDDAILLSVMLDLDPQDVSIPGLVLRLNKNQSNGRWLTTQENAMALMALGKYCRVLANRRVPVTGEVRLGDSAIEKFEEKVSHCVKIRPAGKPVRIANAGKGPMYYSWRSGGVPLNDQAESSAGIDVKRTLLELDGHEPNLQALEQGKLYFMRVNLDNMGSDLDNVVVEDLLPAGLEIENPALATSELTGLRGSAGTMNLAFRDTRDDRMVAFTGEFCVRGEYFYAVRAVTPGTFAWPAISAECMYDPAVRCLRGARKVIVKEVK